MPVNGQTLKSIWSAFYRFLIDDPRPEAGPERHAYDAGYKAFGTPDRNPHRKGTKFHKAWRRGLNDKTDEELSKW
jgi:hypothetical protein